MINMNQYLVGFKCVNHPYGCECTIDVPQKVKTNFLLKYGFDYDEYCHSNIIVTGKQIGRAHV